MGQTGNDFREIDHKMQEMNWFTALKDRAERRSVRGEYQPYFME